ncbi:MAG TPA: phage baseplate assembly protein V, partial [Longimicrobium sp.]|nr:phage baseplate assembly protein V [Longimicrobium sp.]
MIAPAIPLHRPLGLGAAYLAEVVSVQDPDSQGRVQVRLHGWDGVADQDAPIWARVAVPFAGADRGAFLIPDVGDEVLVCFVNADPRLPVVVGGMWNGSAAPPESLSGDRVDRWTFTGKAGTRIAIVEEGGTPVIEMTTPGGVSATLKDEGSGKLELVAAGCTVTLDGAVTIST